MFVLCRRHHPSQRTYWPRKKCVKLEKKTFCIWQFFFSWISSLWQTTNISTIRKSCGDLFTRHIIWLICKLFLVKGQQTNLFHKWVNKVFNMQHARPDEHDNTTTAKHVCVSYSVLPSPSQPFIMWFWCDRIQTYSSRRFRLVNISQNKTRKIYFLAVVSHRASTPNGKTYSDDLLNNFSSLFITILSQISSNDRGFKVGTQYFEQRGKSKPVGNSEKFNLKWFEPNKLISEENSWRRWCPF